MTKHAKTLNEGLGQLTENLYRQSAEAARQSLHDKLAMLVEHDPQNLPFYEAMLNTVNHMADLVAESGKLVETHAALVVASNKELNRMRRQYSILLNAVRSMDEDHPEVNGLMFEMLDKITTDPDLQGRVYVALIERVAAKLGINEVMAAQFMAMFNTEDDYFPEHVQEGLVDAIRAWAEAGFVSEGS